MSNLFCEYTPDAGVDGVHQHSKTHGHISEVTKNNHLLCQHGKTEDIVWAVLLHDAFMFNWIVLIDTVGLPQQHTALATQVMSSKQPTPI